MSRQHIPASTRFLAAALVLVISSALVSVGYQALTGNDTSSPAWVVHASSGLFLAALACAAIGVFLWVFGRKQ